MPHPQQSQTTASRITARNSNRNIMLTGRQRAKHFPHSENIQAETCGNIRAKTLSNVPEGLTHFIRPQPATP
ncbi:hypothetical protein XF_0945 [Xylella fastidiosa 9a5c]|uniref:Uncharacterized protein n=1 Tax=Xylella fastidiosa (strain 9a5c) TaxID=160492 RepID=Q9PET3_XYLFA|nr:hypothetical protein XF_0945 [Xylella fastidiosa 9a5c]